MNPTTQEILEMVRKAPLSGFSKEETDRVYSLLERLGVPTYQLVRSHATVFRLQMRKWFNKDGERIPLSQRVFAVLDAAPVAIEWVTNKAVKLGQRLVVTCSFYHGRYCQPDEDRAAVLLPVGRPWVRYLPSNGKEIEDGVP